MSFFKNQSGMTLVEVLVSLVLLAIVIVAFSGAFISGMRSEVWVNQRLEAARLTESMAEVVEFNSAKLKNYDEANTEANIYSDSKDNLSDIDASLNDLVTDFENKVSSFSNCTIENLGVVAGTTNLYEIRINVEWQDSSYELYTRIHAA